MAGLQRLDELLERCAQRPFRRGSADCMALAAEWIALRTGVEVGSAYRVPMSTRVAMQLLAAHGGSVAMIRALMAAFPETDDPQPGDVGLIDTGLPEPMRAAGAIMLAPRLWAVRKKNGIMKSDFPVLVAWRL